MTTSRAPGTAITPSRHGRRSVQLASGALALACLLGCPIAPPLPVEQEKPNYPPLISEEFVDPPQREIVIVRNDGLPQRFRVDPFLDVNENELLIVYWFSSDNLLSTDTVAPEPGNVSLYRGLFNLYTGSSFDVDPCAPQWLVSDRFPLTVFVSDRQARFADGPEALGEDVFSDSFTWFITFEGECL